MRLCTKKTVKLLSIVSVAISAIMLVISFILKDISLSNSYIYKNNKITHLWCNSFNYTSWLVLAILLMLLIISVLVCVVIRIKSKEIVLKLIIQSCLISVASFGMVSLGNIIVVGTWEKTEYDPKCYEFTDGYHTIVIEEKSFLLYGGGTIYHIKNNNAVILGEINTDDGGRNNGNYEIKWFDNGAEITYNTFISNENKASIKVEF